MSDSFFTAQNRFDDQIARQKFDAVMSEELLEAAARGMVRGCGAIKAAERIQRVADICAGHHVLPYEHWRKPAVKEPVATTPPPPLPRRWRLWVAVRENPGIVFWSGFALGLFWEAMWR